jgi:hypothetical protein
MPLTQLKQVGTFRAPNLGFLLCNFPPLGICNCVTGCGRVPPATPTLPKTVDIVQYPIQSNRNWGRSFSLSCRLPASPPSSGSDYAASIGKG